VVRQLTRADSSVGHVFAFHHLQLATVRLFGQPAQWEPWLTETARHNWFWGNALNPLDKRTLAAGSMAGASSRATRASAPARSIRTCCWCPRSKTAPTAS
jgi:alkylation response protein AidB-like acyl-CoA dehydrogenase